MFGLLGVGLLSLLLKQTKVMYAGLFCCALLSLFLKGESNGSIVFPNSNNLPSFKVLHLNLSSISGNYENAIKDILAYDPDIISFQEVTPEWNAFLKTRLANDYPYDATIVKINPFGKALYSKTEFKSNQTYHNSQTPLLGVTFEKNNRKVRLISSYLSQSINKQGLADAKSILSAIAEVVKGTRIPTIVLGDFNLVYWSNEIRQFRSETGLKNSRRSIPLSSLDLPYDHIFFTQGIQCVEFEDITQNQSHFGIYGSYQFDLIH